MTDLEDYWAQYLGHIKTLTEWYHNQSGSLQRFLKYGGWIALQFWIIRAPMTVFFTNSFPDIIEIPFFKFPGYLLASFTSGTLLAIVGFFLSEWWIWRPDTDEV